MSMMIDGSRAPRAERPRNMARLPRVMPAPPPPAPPRRERERNMASIPRLFEPVPVAPSGRPQPVAPPPVVLPQAPAGPTGPSAADIAARERAAADKARKEAEARARETANNQARERATSDIERLNASIVAAQAKKLTNTQSLDALRKLVGGGEGSHAGVRDSALAALDEALKEKLGQITRTFESSMEDFGVNLRDNEASEHDSTFANFANRAREKQDLVTQALSQGAGESDVLRTQLQALRNWSANQADVNRSFFDTRASVNAGITDLNNATQTGMMNEEMSTNAARGSRWDDYYEAQSNTYSDMADLDQNNYLLQAETDATERQKGVATGLLKWLDGGKNAEDYKPPTLKSTAAAAPPEYTSEYAALAAQAAGSSWQNPGVSASTREWEGGQQSTGGLNTAQLWNAQDNVGLGAPKTRRPEGATLRRW